MKRLGTAPLSVEQIEHRIAYYTPKTGHRRQIKKWAWALWWREHAPDAPWSLRQIGQALGLSTERARQLVRMAKLYCYPLPEEENDWPLN